MKTRLLLFISLFPFLSLFSTESATIREARMLIERVLPHHTDAFILKEIPKEEGHDIFEVEGSKDGKIILRGNNGVSIATAINCYLREFAHISYDWQADKPLNILTKLVLPSAKIHRACAAQQRFFNNTCTFGYTFAYWNWDQWQRFIDWLAMNGVNRPLMQAGQEAVWLRVWQSFGMSDGQVRTYFSAPAHLPWHRMANMDKWGGPLPLSYIDGQEKLQKQIVERCRAFGMKPILSAFAGHVPEQLKSIYPKANITRIAPGWGGMADQYTTYFLDPTDSLFGAIQQRFLKVQQQLYGSDHLYSADPFNEITPPSWEPDYLARVGKTIYETMSAVDKEAVWYQMSWTFYYDSTHWTQPRLAAMIHAVPTGKLVFLDYVCEEQEYFRKSENFHGAPFIWCYLGNFGGNTHLVAPFNKVINRMKILPYSNACAGVGSTLEGLNVNPGIYETVLEMPWRNADRYSADAVIARYAENRAGRNDIAVKDAWNILFKRVLVDTAVAIWNHSIVFQVSPVFDLNKNYWTTNTGIPYSNSDLVLSLVRMLEAEPASKETDAYRFDVVNLTRQALGNYGVVLHRKMVQAYEAKNPIEFRRSAARFVLLGMELDTLLGTRHEFMLGKWLADAGRWGANPIEKAYYERDAREIITTWHQAGAGLTDYSNRQWNGLIQSYYLPRWIEFINQLDNSLTTGQPFDVKVFNQWCVNFEHDWVDNPLVGFQDKEEGDAVKLATRLFEKYKSEMLTD